MNKSFNKNSIINNCGLYMRLSKDDIDAKESASIENQRKILKKYAKEKNFIIYDEYIDDGYTGINMERPGFIRMTEDIKNKKIGIVITKDFSRLGRNSGKVMTIIDDFFVKYNIRYISITEGIDTFNNNNSLILTPMLSFVSEMYSGDISRKINSAFNAKMNAGECISAFAPYGYKKDPANKNHLIPDTECAPIVKRIFNLAKNGCPPCEISDILNKENILTPSMHRLKCYPHLSVNSFNIAEKWSPEIVGKILRREVYLGNTVQGKTHRINFKSKTIENIPKENWIRVYNTHQPLISYDTWQIVRNNLLKRREKREQGYINIFSGIAKCADCGKNMSSVKSTKKDATFSLNCGGYKQKGLKECKSHLITYEALYYIVLNILKDYINIGNKPDFINDIIKNMNTDKLNIYGIKSKLSLINNKIIKLFDSKFEGKIDDLSFDNLHYKYICEKKEYEDILKNESNIKNNTKQTYDKAYEFLNNICNLNYLDKNILFSFVDRIEICKSIKKEGIKYQKINIFFKFSCDNKKKKMEYIL